jgi:hypothetical protein
LLYFAVSLHLSTLLSHLLHSFFFASLFLFIFYLLFLFSYLFHLGFLLKQLASFSIFLLPLILHFTTSTFHLLKLLFFDVLSTKILSSPFKGYILTDYSVKTVF